MKVVLDTNILVSGFINAHGAPAEIVRLVVDGAVTLCFDPRILAEYREVLSRPRFALDPRRVEIVLEQAIGLGTFVTAKPLSLRLPDRDDEPFLEVALAASVDCLVTGNLRHFPKRACGGVEVVSPVTMLDCYRERAEPGGSRQ